jgi:hypothetical protein
MSSCRCITIGPIVLSSRARGKEKSRSPPALYESKTKSRLAIAPQAGSNSEAWEKTSDLSDLDLFLFAGDFGRFRQVNAQHPVLELGFRFPRIWIVGKRDRSAK